MRLKGSKSEPTGLEDSDSGNEENKKGVDCNPDKLASPNKKSRFMRRIHEKHKQSPKLLPQPPLNFYEDAVFSSECESTHSNANSLSGLSTHRSPVVPAKSLRRVSSNAIILGLLNDTPADSDSSRASVGTPSIDFYGRPRNLNTRQTSTQRHFRDGLSRGRSGAMNPRPAAKSDRSDFFNVFSLLIKLGNEQKPTNEGKTMFQKQISRDFDSPQHTFRDMLWLELQAWHHGRTAMEQEEYLSRERRRINPTIEKILNFRYERIELPQTDSYGTLINCTGCLSLYCQYCLMHQSRAMKVICDLLDEIEKVEELYPSSRAFGINYPLYRSDTFTGRCKSLCIWVNTTRKLRMKIDIIGSLVQSSNPRVLWPVWPIWDLTAEEEETEECMVAMKLHRRMSELSAGTDVEVPSRPSRLARAHPEQIKSVDDDVQVVGSGKIYRRSNSKVRFFLEEKSESDTQDFAKNELDDILTSLIEVQSEMSQPNTPSTASSMSVLGNQSSRLDVNYETENDGTTITTMPEVGSEDLGEVENEHNMTCDSGNMSFISLDSHPLSSATSEKECDPVTFDGAQDTANATYDSGNVSFLSLKSLPLTGTDTDPRVEEPAISDLGKPIDSGENEPTESDSLNPSCPSRQASTDEGSLSGYDSLSDDSVPEISIMRADEPGKGDTFRVFYTVHKAKENRKKQKNLKLKLSEDHEGPLMVSSPKIQEVLVPATFHPRTKTLSVNLAPEHLDLLKIGMKEPDITDIVVDPPKESAHAREQEAKEIAGVLEDMKECQEDPSSGECHGGQQGICDLSSTSAVDSENLTGNVFTLASVHVEEIAQERRENLDLLPDDVPQTGEEARTSRPTMHRQPSRNRIARQVSQFSGFTTDGSTVYPQDTTNPSSRRSSCESPESSDDGAQEAKDMKILSDSFPANSSNTQVDSWMTDSRPVPQLECRLSTGDVSSDRLSVAIPSDPSVDLSDERDTQSKISQDTNDQSGACPSSKEENLYTGSMAEDNRQLDELVSAIGNPEVKKNMLSRQVSEAESACSGASGNKSYVSHESTGSVSYPMGHRLINARELQLDTVDDNRAIYHAFVEQELKSKGLRKFLCWVDNLNSVLIETTFKTLASHGPTEDGFPEEQKYGARAKQYMEMNLPSYENLYYFLCRIPLTLKLDCMNIHLNQTVVEPSILTLKELISEMKFLLEYAIKYKKIIKARLAVVSMAQLKASVKASHLEDLEIYNRSLKKSFKVYLTYLGRLVASEADFTESFTASRNFLEEEWILYGRQTALDIPEGEIEAGAAFAEMASLLLGAVANLLFRGLELSDQPEDGDCLEDVSEKQDALSFFRKAQKAFFNTKERTLNVLSFVKELNHDLRRSAEFQLARPAKEVVKKLLNTGHVRVESASSVNYRLFVPSWNDFSIFQRNIMPRVNPTNHVREIRGYYAPERAAIKHSHKYILRLMNLECFWDVENNPNMSEGDEEDGYLIILNAVGQEIKNDRGEVVVIEAGEKPICLDTLQVEGLLLVTDSADDLPSRRRNFQKLMGDSLTLVEESRPSHNIVADALQRLKGVSLTVSERLVLAIREVETKYNEFDRSFIGEPEYGAIMSRGRETINQCYKFGFEYHRDLQRHIGGRLKAQLAERITQLAKNWMHHAIDRCERGRGVRPRWANHGLNFLTLACDPKNTRYLSDSEFEEFKKLINDCLSHVIGTPEDPILRGGLTHRGMLSAGIYSPYRRSFIKNGGSLNAVSDDFSDVSSAYGAISESPTNPESDGGASLKGSLGGSARSLDSFGPLPRHGADWHEKVIKAVAVIEEQRDERLQTMGTIGHVKDVCPIFRVQIKSKTVNFPWQRGVKIGQGRFGKVFVAINMKTGEVYAMKEIALASGDHRALRKLADELRIFEGIKHKNLVRHYGVEIHKDEMLIFMEYCAEGTLEALVDQMGEPLPENLIRRYSRQLLEAVRELHEHGIAHRDIKSANIFLTQEGYILKLGDYGCATKIKSHTTVAGELHGFVGTQAYMAPEVFMATVDRGHGRAADIWSVGCVVAEMATGKRPWNELESNYAIMFRVGMGEHPEVPSSFCADGKDFLSHCLVHDQDERWTAVQLLDHPFVKLTYYHGLDSSDSLTIVIQGHKDKQYVTAMVAGV